MSGEQHASGGQQDTAGNDSFNEHDMAEDSEEHVLHFLEYAAGYQNEPRPTPGEDRFVDGTPMQLEACDKCFNEGERDIILDHDIDHFSDMEINGDQFVQLGDEYIQVCHHPDSRYKEKEDIIFEKFTRIKAYELIHKAGPYHSNSKGEWSPEESCIGGMSYVLGCRRCEPKRKSGWACIYCYTRGRNNIWAVKQSNDMAPGKPKPLAAKISSRVPRDIPQDAIDLERQKVHYEEHVGYMTKAERKESEQSIWSAERSIIKDRNTTINKKRKSDREENDSAQPKKKQKLKMGLATAGQ